MSEVSSLAFCTWKGGGCKLPADRLDDRQRNGWAPRGDRSRYLFKDLDSAVGAEVLLDAFGVAPDAELVAIRAKLAFSVRCFVAGSDHRPGGLFRRISTGRGQWCDTAPNLLRDEERAEGRR
jgi:hypothetical protein